MSMEKLKEFIAALDAFEASVRINEPDAVLLPKYSACIALFRAAQAST